MGGLNEKEHRDFSPQYTTTDDISFWKKTLNLILQIPEHKDISGYSKAQR